MPKQKTISAKAAGKLISAIQKEWGKEIDGEKAELSEDVMNLAHDLLQAGTANKMKELLGPKTLTQFIGDIWLQSHPKVKESLRDLEQAIEKESV